MKRVNTYHSCGSKTMAVSLVIYVSVVIFVAAQGAGSCDVETLEISESQLHPASDFNHYTLVRPKVYHGREKRHILETKEKTGEHIDHIQITLEINKEDLILDLTINNEIISKGFFHEHQVNGKNVMHELTRQEINHCHYNGKIRGKHNSWVALSTCNGLSGVIFDGKEMHYIETKNRADKASLEDQHFMYKHSDMVENNKTCGYDGESTNPEHVPTTTYSKLFRHKRSTDDTSKSKIRGPYNISKNSRYIEQLLVVDNGVYKKFNQSKQNITQYCLQLINTINGYYLPLDIVIALVGIVVWDEYDPIDLSSNATVTLDNFNQYRKGTLQKYPNDNAFLLTNSNFDDRVLGLAYISTMCSYELSSGLTSDHSPIAGIVASTMAHEIGHNLGMEHDDKNCTCTDEMCIMYRSISTVILNQWSSCSLKYLLLAYSHGLDYCLRNKPEKLLNRPVCGNGLVEMPDEQCDCGLPEYCTDPCCNAANCKLYSNASCATGECCDSNTCQPKRAGTLCRQSESHDCDLPEYCDGKSKFCPDDIFKLDLEECDGGEAFCYHGFCRTRSDQCKLLWGETGQSCPDIAYEELNTIGDHKGNCGYSKSSSIFYNYYTYTPCSPEDALCGMLHCQSLRKTPEFGIFNNDWIFYSDAQEMHLYPDAQGIHCKSATLDVGMDQIDPGLSFNGTKCGESKVCVNQRCTDIRSIQKETSCENDCSGNGWCNSRGHCHCIVGFAPPYCEDFGPGGSIDSGPASDPNACESDCNGNGRCINGRCYCENGFQLPFCKANSEDSRDKDPVSDPNACESDCNGNGRCINGRCYCEKGFQLPFCKANSEDSADRDPVSDPNACESDCNGNGRCINGRCYCEKGFQLPFCKANSEDSADRDPVSDPNACESDCNGNGRCINGRCYCENGFQLPFCKANSEDSGDRDPVSDPNACESDCNGNGRCINGRCYCEKGFQLPFCKANSEDSGDRDPVSDPNACESDCNGNGRCINGRCYCEKGFQLPFCKANSEDSGDRDPVSDPNACESDCNGNGRCINGRCYCEKGFQLPFCKANSEDSADRDPVSDPNACESDCNGNGRCINGRCYCENGFQLPFCKANSEDSGDRDPVSDPNACESDCNGNGRCINGRCYCEKGFQLPFCKANSEDSGDRDPVSDPNACESDCNGNGRCINGRCYCEKGFQLPFCKANSEDSGDRDPVSDPNDNRELTIVLYVIFLGVIPMLVFIAALIYYVRHKLRPNWKKTSSNTQPTDTNTDAAQLPTHILEISTAMTLVSTTNNTHNIRNKRGKPKKILVQNNNIHNFSDCANGGSPIKSPRRLSLKSLKMFAFNTQLNKSEKLGDTDKLYDKKAPPVPGLHVKTHNKLPHTNLQKPILNPNYTAAIGIVNNACVTTDSLPNIKLKHVSAVKHPSNVNRNVEATGSVSVKELAKNFDCNFS